MLARHRAFNSTLADNRPYTDGVVTRWGTIDGRKVLFGGDSFQPASRWNGTGGFCAYNDSRFDGFARSARLAMQWAPDILACGHDTAYRFRASKFRKIIRWAQQAQRTVCDLCPSGSLKRDYYLPAREGDRRAGGLFYWQPPSTAI